MSDEKYDLSIGTLSQLTGVNSITLRAWERRYGLLKPHRTEKGHRLYCEDDVGRVREIRFWLAKGIAISKVKPYITNVYTTVAKEDQAFQVEVERILSAVTHFDVSKLSSALDELLSLYPMDIIMEWFLPTFEEALHKHTALSKAAQAETSFFYIGLKQKIRHLIENQKPKNSKGRCLLVRTDQPFERIHLLAMASMLLSYGIESLVIENPVDLHEVPEIASRTAFSWVLLYSSHSGPAISAATHLSKKCPAPLTIVSTEPQAWKETPLDSTPAKLDMILKCLKQ